MYNVKRFTTALLCLSCYFAIAKPTANVDSTKTETQNPASQVQVNNNTPQPDYLTGISLKNNDVPITLRADTTKKVAVEVKKQWFESFSIRGYMQVRYNRLLETNPLLRCDQCDRSWGDGGGFFLRRMRIIFSGNVHDRVYMYIQPDFASSASATNLHFAQIRDAYFDVALDAKKEFRIRMGQSKVPYGFKICNQAKTACHSTEMMPSTLLYLMNAILVRFSTGHPRKSVN